MSLPQPEFLDHALRYAAAGWRVLPLHGKDAFTPDGVLDATNDPARIRNWWQIHPTDNIGFALGTDYWALDVDLRTGGEESLDSLILKHGRLPDTLQQQTGSGGRHFIFKRPPDINLRQSRSMIAPGLDVKTGNGYIVVAPSIHPETKRPYFWDGLAEFEEQPILPAPDWLLALALNNGQPATAKVIAEKIKKGVQHGTLVSFAGTMRQRGAEEEEIFAALEVMNRIRCEEPGPVENIRQIARSAMHWQPGKVARHTALPVNGFHAPPTGGPAAEPPVTELSVTRYDAIQAADSLLTILIESKDATKIYGTVNEPAPYIVALARAGRPAAERAKAQLKAAFPAAYAPQRWSAELNDEIAKLHQAVTVTAKPGWESELLLKKPGLGIAACTTNALLYFENHEEWAGRIAWNEFASEPFVKDEIPALALKPGDAMKDHHDTKIQSWLEKATDNTQWPIDTVRRSLDAWAKAHSFHPVKDYLHALEPWDGTPRLPSWLARYCGAGREPSESDDSPEAEDAAELSAFISAIGERWWISAIARIYQPGCEVHHVLVLEGAKGLGKSTLVRVIFGEWSGFIVGDVATKDSQALLSSGVWGLELDELGILDKSGMRAVKSWVTRPFEKFRPTWGHRHEKRQRQVVFIATVDRCDWADEEDRRWWPVLCQRPFDLAGLAADRDQLMAEALHKYNEGHRWHFDRDEDSSLIVVAQREQAARVPEDTWLGMTQKALKLVVDTKRVEIIGSRRGIFCTKEEIVDCLPERQQNNRDSAANRVGRAMKAVPGWERIQVSINHARPWRYYQAVAGE